MKLIQNNQLNRLLFVKSGEDFSDVHSVLLRQLGSDSEVAILASVYSEDCFAITLDFTLTENQFQNASYILKVIDSHSSVIITSTVEIEGNTDETRAYIIID
jgi:hypothetical protein